MRKLRFVALLAFMVAAGLPVMAQPPIQYVDPVPMDETVGGDYDMCVAEGGWGQTCKDCVLNRYGKQVCAGVRFNAACKCEDAQREGAGPGITDCRKSGNCTYQP